MARQVELQSDKQCLLLGCGYTAQTIAPILLAHDFKVYGTTRNTAKIRDLAAQGIIPLFFNGMPNAEMRRVMHSTTHLISSIGPDENGDPALKVMGKISDQLFPAITWLGYLSATSVYGDRGGNWVFEDELLRPTTVRGKARAQAELDWLESGLPVHIFRIAGIYGPGRNSLLRIRSRKAQVIIKAGHISNRIHVDDIASAVMDSIDTPNPLRIYNLADDHPAPPQDVLNFAASLLGETIPNISFETAKMSDMARSFYAECRRTSNTRAKTELGWSPKYPSYKEGLVQLHKGL